MKVIDVVAGVIRHRIDAGRYLLAQRPAHKIRGGLWEFPGGKIEAGETPAMALARELHEELGLRVAGSAPLFTVRHDYPDVSVRLQIRAIDDCSGEPCLHDAAAIAWLDFNESTHKPLADADRRILRLLQLPSQYVISPDCTPGTEADWLRAARQLEQCDSLLLVRTPSLTTDLQRGLLEQLLRSKGIARERVLVSADARLAAEFGVGLHLRSAQLAANPAVPNLHGPWRGASTHNALQLALAWRSGCDLVSLAAVQATASHPDAEPLGWNRFAELAADADLPVYALGGLHPQQLLQAREAHAWGVAGIRSFWPTITSA